MGERTAAVTLKFPAIVLLVCLFGCGPEAPPPTATGSSFGHFRVETQAPGAATMKAPLTVKVGDVSALDVAVSGDDVVSFTVQGVATPGRAPIVINDRTGASMMAGEVEYAAPLDGRFDRFVAFGASLTMGTQDAGLTMRSQLMGPAAFVARMTGAYLPHPLVKDGMVPHLVLADLDPSTCKLKDGANAFELISARAFEHMLPAITDRDGNILIARARRDPTIEARNIAIGGMRLTEVVNGAKGMVGVGMEHFVWHPQAQPDELVNSPEETMLDRVVALQPSVVMTTDLFGNDFNNVSLGGEGIPDLSALTPQAEFDAALATVFTRLDATGAEVFVGTGPDPTVLPMYDEKIAALRAAGFSEADAVGWRDQIRAQVVAYNDSLRREAALHPRVHIVEVHARVNQIMESGLNINGEMISPKPFGGLLSLDSMHFSDTGYAVLANEYLSAMNEAWGTQLPEVDVAAVHAADPYSVANLRAAGLSCAGASP